MSRKKEVIQKEWDKAQQELTEAIAACKKAIENETVSIDNVNDAETKYAAWGKLLAESVKKIGEWKNEKDSKRLDWMKFVNTQKTKMDKSYETEVARLQSAAKGVIGGRKALQEFIGDLTQARDYKLDLVEKAVTAARAAVAKRNSAEALHQHGTAQNHLKSLTGLVTGTGLKKQGEIYAKKYGVTAKDVNLADPRVVALNREIASGYHKATQAVDELDDEIGALTEDLAAKEPETTSNDPDYKAHLKQCMTDYKSVVDFAKAGLAMVKKFGGDIGKIEAILAKTVAGTAKAVVPAILKAHAGLRNEYKAVDDHIQATIRTGQSTFVKKAADWGITTEDKIKSLKPLTDRAFALNYQAKAVYEKGTDKLIDLTEVLVTKFNCAEAKAALPKLGD